MVACCSDRAAENGNEVPHDTDDATVDETAAMSTHDRTDEPIVDRACSGPTTQPGDEIESEALIDCGDTVADESVDMLTQDPAAEAIADIASGEAEVSGQTTQPGDELKTAALIDFGDTVADETMGLSTQDPATEPTVDGAADETEFGGHTAEYSDDRETEELMGVEAAQMDDGDRADEKRTWYFADIKQQWRKFNIDLMPKVVIFTQWSFVIL